jgi:hypothetical protein
MKTTGTQLRIVAALLLTVCAAAGAYGQSTSGLTDRLAAEEKIFSAGTTVTPAEVADLKALVADIKASPGDASLLPRAELLLELATENESTPERTAALNAEIAQDLDEATAVRRRNLDEGVMRTSFWIGLSSLALTGAALTVSTWANNSYNTASSASAAEPYFVTGQIAQDVGLAGLGLGVLGLGTSWFFAVNPFGVPAVAADGSVVPFPRTDMTTPEKIAYLTDLKSKEQKKLPNARNIRTLAFTSLLVGGAGAIATGVTSYLGNQAFQEYNDAIYTTDAVSLRNKVDVYDYVEIGTAALAFAGMTGAMIGYIAGPDPAALQSSIDSLDAQLTVLEGSK